MNTTAPPNMHALRARADALGYSIRSTTTMAELDEQPGKRALFVQIGLVPVTDDARRRLQGHGDEIIGEAPVDPGAQIASRRAAGRMAADAAALALEQALQLHDSVTEGG